MRKLVWIAAGYAAALMLAHYALPSGWLLYAAAVAGGLALAALALRLVPKPQGSALTAAFLALASAAVGFAWTWGYVALTVTPAEAYAGEKRAVTVRVTGYAEVYDAYSRVEACGVDAEVPHVRMLLYDYDGGFGALRPGDLVEMPLKLLSAQKFYGEDSDYYLANGVHLRGYTTGAYTVVGRWEYSWLYFPQDLARVIREQALECFPADVAPLMKALLTGDRNELSADDALYSALKTAGFIHIIAVSGMHVAFLMGMLRLLTGRRRVTAFLGIPVIVVFMAMIGFKPSVVRAGVMMILLILAPLLRREGDPPTSLAAAGLLILLVNPIAVGSLSFQLSFAAMAGIILVTPRVYGWLTRDEKDKPRLPKGVWGRTLRWICSSFSASVGALAFTTPLSALYFGYVPLYGILTNLLCLWAMSTAFLWGYAVCLLGLLCAPLGAAAGWVLGWLPRYAIFLVKHIARLPWAALCTRGNLGGWWLVFVYLLFIGTYALRGKERYRPVIPVCVMLTTLALLTFFIEKDLRGRLEVTAVDVGQGQSIVAMTDAATAMIDCGSAGSADNAGDRAAEYLLSSGRDRVDLLILTHFHGDHVNGVKRLMSRVEVDRLVIPAAYGENEYSDGILAACGQYGTQVYRVAENTAFTVGDLALTVYAPLGSGDANEECLLIYGDFGDFEFLVTGDAGSGVENRLIRAYELGDMELLVAGHHGGRGSTSAALLDDVTPEVAFISVGEGNGYGHPADEVLERLAARGIQIYRTDLDGTVSVTVGRADKNGEGEETTI